MDAFFEPDDDTSSEARLHDLRQAALLRGARERCGLTRATVAEALNWTLLRLTRLEAGTEVPTLDELLALSRLYALEGLSKLDDIARRHRAQTAPRASRSRA
jgi:transcriptional regulator with XRE-family HTH domain